MQPVQWDLGFHQGLQPADVVTAVAALTSAAVPLTFGHQLTVHGPADFQVVLLEGEQEEVAFANTAPADAKLSSFLNYI